ncbi:MAG: hypothetical protein SFY66_21220 [Oculatellaceae cyanobacterium bins.114]|nr:hypothetical protein [Oculatellaceae cyanobacterium bins.114]
MMPIGIGFLIMVLAIAEWYSWLPGIDLPVPIFIAAGLLLAVASNRGKRVNLPWRSPHAPPLQSSQPKPAQPKQPPSQTSVVTTPVKVIPDPTPVQPPRRSPELPKFKLPISSEKPISFKIRKPD